MYIRRYAHKAAPQSNFASVHKSKHRYEVYRLIYLRWTRSANNIELIKKKLIYFVSLLFFYLLIAVLYNRSNLFWHFRQVGLVSSCFRVGFDSICWVICFNWVLFMEKFEFYFCIYLGDVAQDDAVSVLFVYTRNSDPKHYIDFWRFFLQNVMDMFNMYKYLLYKIIQRQKKTLLYANLYILFWVYRYCDLTLPMSHSVILPF